MASRIVPNLLRRMTVQRLLDLLQDRGPLTRAELVRLSGISAPTVSNAIASLLETGLLEEGDPPSGALGRPAKTVHFATQAAQVLGVTIEARQCRLVAANLGGMLLEATRIQFPTPQSYSQLIELIAEKAKQIMSDRKVTTLALGMSVPGLVNDVEQKTIFSPNLHLTDGCYPSRDLAERLGIDCTLVQETRALCLAERMYNRTSELDEFSVIDMTSGLGLGVVSDGQLLNGSGGLSGELGHITVDLDGQLCGCGNHGCLETIATDLALERRISQQIGRTVSIEEIIQLVHEQDLDISVPVRQITESMAIAVSAVINLFNPKTIFVHGRLFDIDEGILEMLKEMTRRRSLRPSFRGCEILRSRCTKEQGAVAVAIDYLTRSVGAIPRS